MANSNVFAATMSLDNAQFVSGLQQSLNSVDKVAAATGQAGGKISSELGRVFGLITTQASAATASLKTLALGVTGLGAVATALGSVGSIVAGVENQFSQGAALVTLSRQTSDSVADLVELQRAFKNAGSSADSVGGAIFKLQKSLGGVNEDGEPTSGIFAKIGLNIADLKKLGAVDQFSAISVAISKIKDPAAQVDAAFKIFGRSAQDILPILRDGVGFKESTQAAQGQAAQMQKNAQIFYDITRAMGIVQSKANGLFVGIASGVAPALKDVLTYLDKIDFSAIGEQIGHVISLLYAAFKSGQLGELIYLQLSIGLKDGINVGVAGFTALAGVINGIFDTIPEALGSAFDIITNPQFWVGIGELAVAAFVGLQSRLTEIFIHIGVVLKSVLDLAGNGLLEILRSAASTIDQVTGSHLAAALPQAGHATLTDTIAANEKSTQDTGIYQLLDKTVAQSNSQLADAAGKITEATKPLTKTGQDLISNIDKNMKANYENNAHTFDTSAEQAKSNDIISKLNDSLKTSTQAPSAPSGGNSGPSTTPLNYKPADGDRLAKVGLFVGGAAGPSLDYAKRTASATELQAKLSGRLLNAFEKHNSTQTPVNAGVFS